MNKFLWLSVLGVLVILVSCVPPGQESEGQAFAGLAISKGCYDADGDGYGKSGSLITTCSGSRTQFDCNDNNRTINPGAREICRNRKDDNCNGKTDEVGCIPLPIPVPLIYECTPRTEICDGVDNDCDGNIDESPGMGSSILDLCPFDCSDTDGGDNPLVGGHGTFQRWRDNDRTTLFFRQVIPDFCTGEYGINEYYCDAAISSDGIIGTIQTDVWNQYDCRSLNSEFVCIDPDGPPGDFLPSTGSFDYSANIPAYCAPPCTPTASPTEVCDSIDNDCDGTTDEGCTCVDSDAAEEDPNREAGSTTTTDAQGTITTLTDSCSARGSDGFSHILNEATCVSNAGGGSAGQIIVVDCPWPRACFETNEAGYRITGCHDLILD